MLKNHSKNVKKPCEKIFYLFFEVICQVFRAEIFYIFLIFSVFILI